MSRQLANPLEVRLLPPYPSFSTLRADSEVRLRLQPVLDPAALTAELRRSGAEGAAAAGNDAVLLTGTLGGLLARTTEIRPDGAAGPVASALAAALGGLSRPAPPLRLGRFSWEFGHRTYLLGIVNVTPDSFSGDGVGASPEAALARGRQLVEAGADALDIGGESSRPGHQEVSEEEERARVVPALELVASALQVPLFVDTSKSAVARAGLAAGASGVNDIYGLRRDPAMADVAAAAQAPVICMHNHQGTEYADLMGEVLAGLRRSQRLAEAAGLPASQVVLDPGIGFGKLPAQNFEVLRRLLELKTLGSAVLVGTSRKSLISWALDQRPVEGRLLGTAATVAWAISQGADIVRVHDVAEMRDIARVTDLLARRAPRD